MVSAASTAGGRRRARPGGGRARAGRDGVWGGAGRARLQGGGTTTTTTRLVVGRGRAALVGARGLCRPGVGAAGGPLGPAVLPLTPPLALLPQGQPPDGCKYRAALSHPDRTSQRAGVPRLPVGAAVVEPRPRTPVVLPERSLSLGWQPEQGRGWG